MKTIWKYPFRVSEFESCMSIHMPEGAEVLSVQMQGNTPCLWAIVDMEPTPEEIRQFTIFGTGHAIPNIVARNLKYLSTFQQPPYVWHFFEVNA